MGKHTSEYPDAGKETQFTRVEIGEKKLLRSARVKKLQLLQFLGCPAIPGVKYIHIFDLTGTALTTFHCHV